jgi:chaperone modulatory protein CbpM
MAVFYTEEQVLAAVVRLDRVRLVSYIETDVVRPVESPEGPRFRSVDIARLELLCELTDEFGLEGETLGVVVRLLDQLHDTRADLEALSTILADEPYEIRARIGSALARIRG